MATATLLPELRLTHLKQLEAEAIHIIREVVSQFERPVMLYSIGKDSSVLLHLARKAFYPGKIPFPLLHIDTTWKFREMIEFRDRVTKELGLELRVHSNQEGIDEGINPFEHGSKNYTDIMKTQALKQALTAGGYDAAFGGARRDEEKSRAKERVFSFRDKNHRWDPKNQRPELWNLFNGRKNYGEHFRVFPISNWTEMDVWEYIKLENIKLPSLYFSHKRDCVVRDGVILANSEFIKLKPGEDVVNMTIRYRTCGDMPITGAVISEANTLEKIIEEIATTRTTERGGRADDKRAETAMEDRKKQGYF